MPKKKTTRKIQYRTRPKKKAAAAKPRKKVTIASRKKALTNELLNKYGDLQAKKFQAPTKRAKKKLQKQITDVGRQIRKLR